MLSMADQVGEQAYPFALLTRAKSLEFSVFSIQKLLLIFFPFSDCKKKVIKMPGAETEQKATEEVQKQEEEKTPVEQMKEKVAEEGNFS